MRHAAPILGLLLAFGAAVAVPTRSQPPSQVGGLAGLRNALDRYQAIASGGGWPVLPRGSVLVPGTRSDRILVLRRRLAMEGYPVSQPAVEQELYDEAVGAAVRRFQGLHGLIEDGVVGPATLADLNVPAEARAAQIARNLGRAVPDSIGDPYVIVNIAAFTLAVIERGRPALTLRAIVGRPDWPTPVTHSPITGLVFGPKWTIPRSIAVQEILPQARRSSAFLRRSGIRILRDSASGGGEVDPDSIDWRKVSARTWSYQFVQDPGPNNPLGGVKFVLRTPENVHLHDTPARALFDRRRRAFSHGCIRVEHPERLVAYLLPAWTADSIRLAMEMGGDSYVPPEVSIPVHIVYWTAWIEPDGMVAFREDVYRWDVPKGQG